LPGYFQPVEIMAPQGVMVSTASPKGFDRPDAAPLKLGLLIGSVYRLRVTNLPLHPGVEVFPTIEVIDRLYPPLGKEHRFPIPIVLTAEDLELAAEGRFVTRVIYIENPHDALPQAIKPENQSVMQVGPGEDPLVTADELGRPVAILRMGGRVPGSGGADQRFLYGAPAFLKYRKGATGKGPPDKLRQPGWRRRV
jgi:hypothetical protein